MASALTSVQPSTMTGTSASPLVADSDITALRTLQAELIAHVVLRDGFIRPLRTVAGFNVGIESDSARIYAAAVLLDALTLDVVASEIVHMPACPSAHPDLASFRELPAMLEALQRLPHRPDLVFVGGHGIAHPNRFGIAAHFGVASDLPSIGVAKAIQTGASRTNLHEMRGAFTSLREGATQIGWVLRSKPGCEPLIVSPGHRVAMASSPELVMRFVTHDRLPEPLRLADLWPPAHR